MNISPTITRALHKGIFEARKHSPIILTAAGVVGVVAAGVLAARATLKLEDTLDASKKRLEMIEDGDKNGKTRAVVSNVLDLVKLYGPSVTLGVASLACIVSSQGIMHRRNALLLTAYKGLESAYSNYRARVVEEYGAEVDHDFHNGLKTVEIKDADGKKVLVKQTVSDNAQYGEYTFIFGPDNPNWVGIHEHNEFFIRSQQAVLNDILRTRGYVTLNQALERLGMAPTPAGFLVGWVYKPNGNENGDNFIDFRPFNTFTAQAAALEVPERGHWLLDMNVDGEIWDKI